ncbi:hypothetical protein C2I19_10810 [Chromobacterium alticapitis]|uniref:Uncharacterized protein n=2 Tax=Chromobacterium alticapitis TaxID=2073169 RepID=A0A2S5DFU5_9NEIS|nr:hypothetical protein C2I19_10810 [Chromobacterium alticapitis]
MMSFTILKLVFNCTRMAIDNIEEGVTMASWSDWLKGWRNISDETSTDEYEPITDTLEVLGEEEEFEVLRISKFHPKYDGNKQYIETTIREFNDNKAKFSRLTMYLGIGRLITFKHKPVFVLEPGADAIKYVAHLEGVSMNNLVNAMRKGQLGRKVRSEDRLALKNSVAQQEAEMRALEERALELEREKAIVMEELAHSRKEVDQAKKAEEEARKAQVRMIETVIQQNSADKTQDGNALTSGTRASPIGKAITTGFKPTTNGPVPGSACSNE